jgi:hypothetical protein
MAIDRVNFGAADVYLLKNPRDIAFGMPDDPIKFNKIVDIGGSGTKPKINYEDFGESEESVRSGSEG